MAHCNFQATCVYSRKHAQMRAFYKAWPTERIFQTVPAKSSQPVIRQTVSGKSNATQIAQTPSGLSIDLATLAARFPLPWSAYVRLLSVKNEAARAFYETEELERSRRMLEARRLARPKTKGAA